MCKDCGVPDDIVGYYHDFYNKIFTIEQCKRCKGINHNIFKQ